MTMQDTKYCILQRFYSCPKNSCCI